MAKGKRYSVKFRRRREGKTNYKKRLAFVKSDLPRLVVRRSNKYFNLQIIDNKPNGDVTLAHFNSKNLTKLGWKHSSKNTPAAYLSGYKLAEIALKNKVKEAIFDMGSYTPTKGCTIYGALSGAIAGGLKISHSKEVLPSKDRIEGKHISDKLSVDLNKLIGGKSNE